MWENELVGLLYVDGVLWITVGYGNNNNFNFLLGKHMGGIGIQLVNFTTFFKKHGSQIMGEFLF